MKITTVQLAKQIQTILDFEGSEIFAEPTIEEKLGSITRLVERIINHDRYYDSEKDNTHGGYQLN